MTEPGFPFYEHQKTTRVQYCTRKEILSSYLKVKNCAIHYQRTKIKIISDALSMKVADFTESEMENCAESNSDINFVPSEDLLQN